MSNASGYFKVGLFVIGMAAASMVGKYIGSEMTHRVIAFFEDHAASSRSAPPTMDDLTAMIAEKIRESWDWEAWKLVPKFEMVKVPSAKIQYAERRDLGLPAYEVIVSDFEIGKYEVTQKLWKEVMGEDNNPSRFKGDSLPVENVSWNDVQNFFWKLNEITEKFRNSQWKYGLPTEAEWELAARGSLKSGGYIYSGSNNLDGVGWYYENSGDKPLDGKDWNNESRARGNLARNNNRTRPAGTKEPNELGIHDMSGNVSEWVGDWYGEYTAVSNEDYMGPETGTARVLRGGSWKSATDSCRIRYRGSAPPGYRADDVGFRIALGRTLSSLKALAAEREAEEREREAWERETAERKAREREVREREAAKQEAVRRKTAERYFNKRR